MTASPRRTALFAGVLLSASASALAQPPAGPGRPDSTSEREASPNIVVVAPLTARPAETAPQPVTGSRIAGAPGIQFHAVSTRTGVAGLVPGSGMDPFAGATRYRTETLCRSNDQRLAAAEACRIASIQRLFESRAFESARNAIDRLVSEPGASDEERYVAAGFLYRIGIATGDPIDRENALRLMLETDAMSVSDRPLAYRSLVAIALRRDDVASAIGLLETLVESAPDDSRSRGNLAALYARAGLQQEAATLVEDAIAVARRRGETVPTEWLTFAGQAGELPVVGGASRH